MYSSQCFRTDMVYKEIPKQCNLLNLRSTQCQWAITRLCYPACFLAPKDLVINFLPTFGLWAFTMKAIPETRHAH